MATTPEAYVHRSTDKTTLTFYYDTLRADRNGETWGIRDSEAFSFLPAWTGERHSLLGRCRDSPVFTAVFDASFRDFRPTTTAGWFYELNLLERIEGLEHLNTSQVTDMWKMFRGCTSLTSLDLSSFDTSQVTKMSSLFSGCGSLTSLDLTSFDTSKVTNMGEMFYSCESLTTIYCNLSWSARHSDDMFSGCNSLRGAATNVGYDVSMANPETGYFTKNVLLQEDEAYVHLSADKKTLTFYFDKERYVRRCCECLPSEVASKEEITQIVIDESFRNVVPKITASWFEDFSAVTEIRGLDNLNTSEVTDMSRMFAGCSALRSLDVSRFDTSQVTGMSSMFSGCASLTELDLYFFDTAKVTDMHEMFNGCKGLTTLDLQSFNTLQVTNMSELFADCSALVDIDISRFDTAQVTDMHAMFSGCAKLSALNLAHFDTAQVMNMHAMFKDCKSLTTLDLSNFQTSEVKNMSDMFSGCSALTTILSIAFRNCFVSDAMFYGCTSLQGAVNFNEKCTDARMANPERGYFSKR